MSKAIPHFYLSTPPLLIKAQLPFFSGSDFAGEAFLDHLKKSIFAEFQFFSSKIDFLLSILTLSIEAKISDLDHCFVLNLMTEH